ncbi:hypothetical protein [Candidatus Raskinella chloraquaticus]
MRTVLYAFGQKDAGHLLEIVKARNFPRWTFGITGDGFGIGEWQQR